MAVKIIFKISAGGEFHSVFSKGHADFAPHGSDIVCSAISSLLQTLLLGAERMGIPEKYFSASPGKLFLELPDTLTFEDRIKMNFLFETIYNALLVIESQYPDKLFIRKREV